MRAFASSSITFGLVSIPVKLYVSASDDRPHLNMLTKDGHRVKQQMLDAETSLPVEHSELDRGYEVSKGQFVRITKEELASLETKANQVVEILEFVPIGHVDFVQSEKTYYLSPDKGGDKGYTLLAETLAVQQVQAIARWTNRGKQHLVTVRTYRGGLALQVLFYSSEVRDFEEVKAAKVEISQAERDLANQLVAHLTKPSSDISQYTDECTATLMRLVDAKVAGREIEIPQASGQPAVLDLFDALKRSLEISAQNTPKLANGTPSEKINGSSPSHDKNTNKPKSTKKSKSHARTT
jgi:DNA end-binding protein Ku